MATVVTAEQRASKDPVMKEWVIAKDKENAPVTAQPMSAGQAGAIPSVTGSVPIAGPMLPGVARPTGSPVSAPVAASTPTAAPMNGTLQGPYPTPNGGIQQGANVVNGKIQYNQPVSAGQAQQSQSAQQAPPDYTALAAARTALALQQKQTIANQQKASADASYQQQSLRTKDSRVLDDFRRTQTADVFNGRTSFQEGLIGRERTQADADASAALATQKGNIDQLLADYQNATADEQVRIADELQRADRAYQLDLAKFNQGQSNWEKEFGQSQQQIDYSQNPNNPNNIGQSLNNAGQALTNQLNELKLGNYSTEQKQQAALFEQQIKSGQMSNEAAAYNLAQLKDPNSASNQAAKIDLQLKQLDLKNAPETARLKLQQLQKEIAQIGVVHYKPQTAAEKEMDQLQIQKITAEISKLNNAVDKPTPIPSKDSTNNLAYYQDQTDNSTHSKADKLAFAESHQGDLTDADYRTWIASINKSE